MKFKRYYLVLILISLVCSGIILFQRHKVEQTFDKYEITMTLGEVVDYALDKDMSVQDTLKMWKEVGVDTITLNEISIASLKRNGTFDINTTYEGNDVIVTGTKEGIDLVSSRIKDKLLHSREIIRVADDKMIIKAKKNDFYKGKVLTTFLKTGFKSNVEIRITSIFENVGLGYLESDIALIKDAGFMIRFRPSYISGVENAKVSIDKFFEYVDKYSNQPYVSFMGKHVLGTDTELDYMAENIKKRNMSVTMIESNNQRMHEKQEDLGKLVEKCDFKANRAFITLRWVQKRFDYEIPFHHHGEEVMNTFFRAITERNINLIYFRPYLDKNKYADLDKAGYQKNFINLEKRLLRHGMVPISKVGQGSDTNFYMDSLNVNRFLVMLVAFGVVASCLLLLNIFVKVSDKFNMILMIIGLVLTAIIYAVGIKLSIVNKLFGLLTTLTFAMLAITYIVYSAKQLYVGKEKVKTSKLILKGIVILFLGIMISLVGSFIQAGFFADMRFILELDIFRGVKISKMLPLVLSFAVCFYYFSEYIFTSGSSASKIKQFLNANIKVWQILVLGVLGLGALILMLRSGHESGASTSSLELFVRNMLEIYFYARARNKAFIIGFPIVVMLIVVAGKKKYTIFYPVLTFIVAVGQTDVLNTFSHIRTPLDMSIARVFIAFALSIVMFALYYLIYKIFKFLFLKSKASLVNKSI